MVATIGLAGGRDQDTCRETTEGSKVSIQMGLRHASHSNLAMEGGGRGGSIVLYLILTFRGGRLETFS